MDPGSSGTLVREGLVHRLGLKAPLRAMGLSGVGGFKSSYLSKRVTLALQTVLGTEVTLNTSSIASPCDPLPVVDWSVLKHKWAHKSDLPLEKTGGRIDVLIVFDNNYLGPQLATGSPDHFNNLSRISRRQTVFGSVRFAHFAPTFTGSPR